MGNPTAANYAVPILNIALQVDPNNKRAQMYKALLGPIVAAQGAWTRFKPLVLSLEGPEYQTRYEQQIEIDRARNSYPSNVVEFMLQGREDVRTVEDAQAFVDSIRDAFLRIKEFHKNNRSLDISVNIASSVA